ncbi:MAG: class IV adenylate cyclase [Candidatus Hodarchaeota archaeon]
MKVLVKESPEWAYERLKKQNCTHIKNIREIDYYLDTPDHSLAGGDQAFRIRISRDITHSEIPERIEVTFKGPKIDKISKTREELGFFVQENSIDTILNVFQRLGFSEVFEISKNRSLWQHPSGTTLSVDLVDQLAPDCYIEAEIISDSLSDQDQLVRKLMRILCELLDHKGRLQSERRSYLQLAIIRKQTII